MAEALHPHAFALLEDSFTGPPKRPQRQHVSRRSDSYRQYLPAAAPLQLAHHGSVSSSSSLSSSLPSENEAESVASSQQSTPLASPGIAPGAEANGLPPTPPTISRHTTTAANSLDPPPNTRNSFVGSIVSRKSALSTPVNARSPPTPDPSPPRNPAHRLAVDRPPLAAYPSSRADSFTTAREDVSSENSREPTPVAPEHRGLGLAFEHDDGHDEHDEHDEHDDYGHADYEHDNDATPTEKPRLFYPTPDTHETALDHADTTAGAHDDHHDDDHCNTDLMRHVTVRRKRKQSLVSSPVADLARPIGWPAEVGPAPDEPHDTKKRDEPHDTKKRDEPHHDPKKRMSTASVASTVVAALVIATPPPRQPTLRHSGKNMALRGDPPLHRLVHKKDNLAHRANRLSTDSDAALSSVTTAPRNASPFSVRSTRTIDSSAYTLAHQESVRSVLQPAADILSRSNSQRIPDRSPRMRISSAPESAGWNPRMRISSAPDGSPRMRISSPPDRNSPMRISSPPESGVRNPRMRDSARQAPHPASNRRFVDSSPPQSPQLPHASTVPAHRRAVSDSTRQTVYDAVTQDKAPPLALLDRVRVLVAERDAQDELLSTPTVDQRPASPPVRRASRLSPMRSEERRKSCLSQDRTSPLQNAQRTSFDRATPEDYSRRSYDGQRTSDEHRRSYDERASDEHRRSYDERTSDEHRRISFDRSTGRTEEHANARHLYSQSTPFSHFSDTPIELSEATAVSIYPHKNNSLLVVQQPSRTNSMVPEPKQLADGAYFDSQDAVQLRQELIRTPTPPFVDAVGADQDSPQVFHTPQLPVQPTLSLEPSTPPMQTDLPQPDGVDSPLKNPRSAPEPPKFIFIPPTPAEELERTLELGPPGPPKHSDSHPQRRLSLVQRARRYSDNFISPFLTRASSNRGRYYSDSHARSQSSHRSPNVPTVNDDNGALHPFWRPRGFWDGFEDSDSDEDNVLPTGGDTSDMEDTTPEPYPRRRNTLRNRLTHGFHAAPPLRSQSSGIRKRGSQPSLRSSASFERPGANRRQSWRKGKNIPGLKGYQVQYIGVSGIKDRLKERTAEKRRDKIRRSIGSRYYVEPNSDGAMGIH